MTQILRAHELRAKLEEGINHRSAQRNEGCLSHENFQWDMETWRKRFRVEGMYSIIAMVVEPLLALADMSADEATNKILNDFYTKMQDDILSGKIG